MRRSHQHGRAAWIGSALLLLTGCVSENPAHQVNGGSLHTRSNAKETQSGRSDVEDAGGKRYEPPARFLGYPWGTPLRDVSGLTRDASSIVENSRGTVAHTSITCMQREGTHASGCANLKFDQTVVGAGSYAFGVYHFDTVERSAFPGSDVQAAASLYLFCGMAPNGNLPRELTDVLRLCGGENLFKSDTLAEERARHTHNETQTQTLRQLLQELSPDDPKYGELLSILHRTLIEEEEYHTPYERVLDWLIARYGFPQGYERRGRIRIDPSPEQASAPTRRAQPQSQAQSPSKPRYLVHRWCQTARHQLRPDCTATITLACEVGVSGVCSVLLATSPLYEFARARHEDDADFWVYRLLQEDATTLARTRVAARRSDCVDRLHCATEQRPLTAQELSAFDSPLRTSEAP